MGWEDPNGLNHGSFRKKEVQNTQNVLSGLREIGWTMAATLWGSELHKDSYVEFEPLDLEVPIFINNMTSGSITKTSTDSSKSRIQSLDSTRSSLNWTKPTSQRIRQPISI